MAERNRTSRNTLERRCLPKSFKRMFAGSQKGIFKMLEKVKRAKYSPRDRDQEGRPRAAFFTPLPATSASAFATSASSIHRAIASTSRSDAPQMSFRTT